MLQLLLIIAVWSAIWVVPASIAGHRRRTGRPIRIYILMVVFVVEIVVAVSMLKIGAGVDWPQMGVVGGPVVASALAAALYVIWSRHADAQVR